MPGYAVYYPGQRGVNLDAGPHPGCAYRLSARERQIARLLLDGSTSAEITRTLHISGYTANDHIKAVFRKTGAHSRQEPASLLSGH